jgi:hypothetical protein
MLSRTGGEIAVSSACNYNFPLRFRIFVWAEKNLAILVSSLLLDIFSYLNTTLADVLFTLLKLLT